MAPFHSYFPSYYICHSKYSPLIKYSRSFMVYLFIPGPWCIKPSQRKNHSFHCTQNYTMSICLPPITTSLVNLFPLEYKIYEIRNLHSNMKKKIYLKIKNLIGMFCCILWFLVSETLLYNLHLKPQTDFIPCHLQRHREVMHIFRNISLFTHYYL